MTAQLDSALAVLAARAGTAVDQLGPEAMKAYGGMVHAQTHVFGLFLLCLIVADLILLAIYKLTDNGELAAIMGVFTVIGTIIAGFCYGAATIELATYMSSPAGATAMHLAGK